MNADSVNVPYCTMQPKQLKRFTDFLVAHGADILTETNPYEVLRVRTARGVFVLYRKKGGRLTWPDELVKAFQAYKGRGSWSAGFRHTRSKKPSVKLRSVLDRDGNDCFYCGRPFTEGKPATLEHLVPVVHGGTNHLSNLAAAHEDCNEEAHHLPVVEKVALRDRKRGQR